MSNATHIDQYIGYLRVREYSACTIEDRQRVLRFWSVYLPTPILDASPRTVQDFFDRPDWTAQTRQTYLGHLRGFYKWAVQQELILADPTRLTGAIHVRKTLPKPYSGREISDALARLGEPCRTWLILAVYAGLRCMEIAGLHGEDVDRITGSLFIRRQKGGADARMPMHPMIREALDSYPMSGPLFTDESTGNQLNRRQVSMRGRNALHRAGIGGSLHRGRHSFGTQIHGLCRDAFVTQQAMRHVSPATTARYVLVADGAIRDAVLALPNA